MASKEINLLQAKQEISSESNRWKNLLLKVVTPFLFLFIAMAVLIIGVNIYLDQQLNSVKTQVDSELVLIKSMEKNEGIYMLLKQKATAISTIMQNRYAYDSVYNFVENLNQKGGKVLSLSISEAGNVSLSVEIPDTQTLDDFLKAIIADAEKRFNKVQLNGITYKPGTNYMISFTINAKNIKTN